MLIYANYMIKSCKNASFSWDNFFSDWLIAIWALLKLYKLLPKSLKFINNYALIQVQYIYVHVIQVH